MKNTINILIILILTLGLLAGCTNIQDTTATTATTATPESVVSQTSEPTEESIPTEEPVTDADPGYGAAGSFENSDFSLEQMLIYALQDEYLARGEYEYLINELNAGSPFTNIIKAEETHISLLLPLFEKYSFEAPEDTSSEYLIPATSITEALETGVLAEVNNIAMYELFLETELPDDVRAVFVELRDGSKNHLAAFERKLSR